MLSQSKFLGVFEVEVGPEPVQDLGTGTQTCRHCSHVLAAQENKQFGVAHHVGRVVHHEIVDQLAVSFPHVAHRHSVVQQQRSHLLDLRLQVGAVSALNEGRSTHEAENMTSHSLGSEKTSSSKLASVSSTTPSMARTRERRARRHNHFMYLNTGKSQARNRCAGRKGIPN